MAQGRRLSELTVLSDLNGAEEFYTIKNGTSYRVSLNQLKTWLGVNGSGSGSGSNLSGGMSRMTKVASAGTDLNLSLDYTDGISVYYAVLDRANCNITFSDALVPEGFVRNFTLVLIQGTGSNKVANWPYQVSWNQEDVPALSYTANRADVFEFVTFDGGNTYVGFFVGNQVPV